MITLPISFVLFYVFCFLFFVVEVNPLNYGKRQREKERRKKRACSCHEAVLSPYVLTSCLRLLCQCTQVHSRRICSFENIVLTVSPQTYLNHPFDTREDPNIPRRLQDTNWQPLRIHVDSSDLAKHTFSTAGKRTLDRITKSIIPQAVKVLNKYLNVVPVNGNLKIIPDCQYQILGKPCCGIDPRCTWSYLTTSCAVYSAHCTFVPNIILCVTNQLSRSSLYVPEQVQKHLCGRRSPGFTQ